ncbi:uncharacterized protein LOC133534754 [Cydia pomonella]|uniref:uncharacterized protein LOC133526551 n=1 Tax=Cydia pomonella TaxID=82600 RepID=UPI002ADD7461|nr:uncharacterized protein LOC133526551 [Cydia pomonella]XP_061720106.1 uncharacterized protein LOC133527221 [Cydia pomonella]XP_061720107.1 uncharacterized protein LOC133527221 [Cydia pomonella]XP_061726137.1 uncharacterized protein LOC133531763 [Cydia pomonella]XP_061730000.1 uncharacterized protein LOC133534754 [Cydia pomonella]
MDPQASSHTKSDNNTITTWCCQCWLSTTTSGGGGGCDGGCSSSTSQSSPGPQPMATAKALLKQDDGDKGKTNCLESASESDTSDEMKSFYQGCKSKWIKAFQNNTLINRWRLPMPFHTFRAEVARLLKRLYIEGHHDDCHIYPLIVMWDDLNDDVEEIVGDAQINYQDWIALLGGVTAELFSRVVFNTKSFNYLINVIFCVLGPNIIASGDYECEPKCKNARTY